MPDKTDKIKAGMARGIARGRKPGRPYKVSDAQIRKVMAMGTAVAAKKVGLTKAQYILRRRRLEDQNDE